MDELPHRPTGHRPRDPGSWRPLKVSVCIRHARSYKVLSNHVQSNWVFLAVLNGRTLMWGKKAVVTVISWPHPVASLISLQKFYAFFVASVIQVEIMEYISR